MESSYNKEKLQETLRALEDGIREIENRTEKPLHEKRKRDGKQKELHEVERKLGEEKRLVKQTKGIERLISYAGGNCSISRVYEEQMADWEKKRAGIKQELKAYGGREAVYADAVEVEKYLRVYRKLCSQLWPTDENAGDVLEELNRWVKVYLPRKNALGIGSRLMGLSEGMLAASRNLKMTAGQTPSGLSEYIGTTAEMLADYIDSHKLDSQGRDRLNNMLATLYIWLALSEYDQEMAQSYFDRLTRLKIRWSREECPSAYFERFYELKRQDKATLATFRILRYFQMLEGSESHVDGLGRQDNADAVRAYLDGVGNGMEPDDKALLDMAKQIMNGCIRIPSVMRFSNFARVDCTCLKEMVSKFVEFRGRPYFKEIEETISAAVNAYYDDQSVREEIKKAYREYLEAWIRDISQKQRNDMVSKNASINLAEQYPLDDLEREIEACKSGWEILEPGAFRSRMGQVQDSKRQKETLQHIVRTGEYNEEFEIILEGISGSKKMSLIPMLAAVLAPLNILTMLVFEFILAARHSIAQPIGKEDRRAVWAKQANGRLNMISTAAMCLFWLTGGYSVLDFSYDIDAIGWLFSFLGFGVSLLCVGVFAFVIVPYFVWSVFNGLKDLLKGIHKNERTKM